MPDEDVAPGDEPLEEGLEGDTESTDESPYAALELKMAALEQAQRMTVTEVRTAVGRVQSLAAQLNRTNDPALETKLRTELSSVSELLGVVTDSIDESILPRDVKQKVADARAVTRANAADAEINRRIAEATRPVQQAMPEVDANRIEAAVVSQIQSLGLDSNDPAFDWQTAANLLHTRGEQAMWAYFGTIERELMGTEGGPQRRGRPAPRAASAPAPTAGVARFLDKNVSDADKITEMLARGNN